MVQDALNNKKESVVTSTSLFGSVSESHHNLLLKKLEDAMKKPPFNAGFGMYLYLSKNKVRSAFSQPDVIFKDILSHGLRDMDVYVLTEQLRPEQLKELEVEHAKVAEKFRGSYLKFFREFQRVYLRDCPSAKLLKAVNANNILEVKKLVKDSCIPPDALKTI